MQAELCPQQISIVDNPKLWMTTKMEDYSVHLLYAGSNRKGLCLCHHCLVFLVLNGSISSGTRMAAAGGGGRRR